MKTLPCLLLSALTLSAATVVMVPNTTGVGGDLMLATNYSVIVANGTTLNQTVAVGVTTFWPLFGGAAATNLTADVTTGTRSLIALPTILTNLYFYSSAAVGSGRTTTLTILTNGVSTGMSAAIAGASATKSTNTASSVSVPAGVEVGVSILTAASSTAVKYSWAVNLLQ